MPDPEESACRRMGFCPSKAKSFAAGRASQKTAGAPDQWGLPAASKCFPLAQKPKLRPGVGSSTRTASTPRPVGGALRNEYVFCACSKAKALPRGGPPTNNSKYTPTCGSHTPRRIGLSGPPKPDISAEHGNDSRTTLCHNSIRRRGIRTAHQQSRVPETCNLGRFAAICRSGRAEPEINCGNEPLPVYSA